MFRLATEKDLEAVARIYEEILDEEDKRPVSFTNWQRGKYPTLDTARTILAEGTLWVGEENGEIWGSANLNGVQLPEYDAIPWSIPARREEVMFIHTLTISPRWMGKGKGREFVAFCEEQARRQGGRVIRLDTYEGNHPANHMYPKLGYRYAGVTEFFFMGFIHENLNCYEKQL